ncbi:MAG: winged helix-turn-helix domain-containing protein [Candidatus Aenigmatarchaeota archaeon]
MPEQLDRAALKALGADTRQAIIKALERRPHTASELARVLGKHVTTVSEHLDVLEQSGLVARRDDGHKWVYYALSDKGMKLFKPKFYSWTILLGISIVMMVGGGMLAGFAGGAQSADMLGEAAGAEQMLTTAPPPAPASPAEPLAMAGIALLALGLFGISVAIVKLRGLRNKN